MGPLYVERFKHTAWTFFCCIPSQVLSRSLCPTQMNYTAIPLLAPWPLAILPAVGRIDPPDQSVTLGPVRVPL